MNGIESESYRTQAWVSTEINCRFSHLHFLNLISFVLFSEPAVAVRSSIADARGTLQLGYDTDSGSEKQDRETEKYSMRRQAR